MNEDSQTSPITDGEKVEAVTKQYSITQEELDKVISKHLTWHLSDGEKGQRAELGEFDLAGLDFARANLSGADFTGTRIPNTEFTEANLSRVNFTNANLKKSYLLGADLWSTNFSRSDLTDAELADATIRHSNFRGANLSGVNFTGTVLLDSDLDGCVCDEISIGQTRLIGMDLTPLINAKVIHRGQSTIDHVSIARSLKCGNLEKFLIEVGMPHIFATYAIDSMKALDQEGLFNLMHTTFISYGGPDEDFATRLQNALQKSGVITYLFSKHAVPGRSLSNTMRTGVREHDRTILICSKSSLNRPGVLNEIELTLQREASEGGRMLLIPIALDTYVYDEWNPENVDHKEAILNRVIGDFKGADTSQRKFDNGMGRLLQALKITD